MAIKDIWNKIFGSRKVSHTTTNRLLQFLPVSTSSFGEDVFKSNLVIACIHAIAEECSKMIIQSVRVTDSMVIKNNDSLNRLLKNRPNALMTTKDLLYWIADRLERKLNAYLFPEIKTTTYSNGKTEDTVVAIYPLDSVSENVTYNDSEQRYYIKFTMRNGEEYECPYEYVIHLRKHFVSTEMIFAKESRVDLLQHLKIADSIVKLMPESIKASMQTKGVLTANSLADAEGLKKFKRDFEQNRQDGNSTIAVLDVSGTFTPVNISPQTIDAATLSYLQNTVLQAFGVPLSIIIGNATEADWASFYQKNIEPFKMELEQAMTSVLFSQKQRDFGNEIRCYDRLVQHYTIATRLSIVKELGARNYLSRSEQRELLGFEPDGGPEKVSLNFVDSDKANQYQGVDNKEENNGTEDNKSVQSDGTSNE